MKNLRINRFCRFMRQYWPTALIATIISTILIISIVQRPGPNGGIVEQPPIAASEEAATGTATSQQPESPDPNLTSSAETLYPGVPHNPPDPPARDVQNPGYGGDTYGTVTEPNESGALMNFFDSNTVSAVFDYDGVPHYFLHEIVPELDIEKSLNQASIFAIPNYSIGNEYSVNGNTLFVCTNFARTEEAGVAYYEELYRVFCYNRDPDQTFLLDAKFFSSQTSSADFEVVFNPKGERDVGVGMHYTDSISLYLVPMLQNMAQGEDVDSGIPNLQKGDFSPEDFLDEPIIF